MVFTVATSSRHAGSSNQGPPADRARRRILCGIQEAMEDLRTSRDHGQCTGIVIHGY
ncbi:hypothetical protein C8Q79DRAFT_422071 [Trametes meyenii]|nr:hypothetical protein C8Q79DRAFT_422071 [Trametes meyenii]